MLRRIVTACIVIQSISSVIPPRAWELPENKDKIKLDIQEHIIGFFENHLPGISINPTCFNNDSDECCDLTFASSMATSLREMKEKWGYDAYSFLITSEHWPLDMAKDGQTYLEPSEVTTLQILQEFASLGTEGVTFKFARCQLEFSFKAGNFLESYTAKSRNPMHLQCTRPRRAIVKAPRRYFPDQQKKLIIGCDMRQASWPLERKGYRMTRTPADLVIMDAGMDCVDMPYLSSDATAIDVGNSRTSAS